jgi:radical SAM protein with 4Fe4S-binding SPASM domain
VAIAHEYRPKAHKLVITNGGGLLRKPGPAANIKALFEAGLNVLALDDYEGVKFVEKISAALEEHGPLVSGEEHPLGFKFWDYPQDLAGNPHQRRPRGTRMLVRIQDISVQSKTGNHGKLFNYAGVGFAPNDKMAGKRCHHPFRQLAVRQDGSVAICCNDWRGTYVCGNVNTDGVEAIWQGDAMGAAREMLIKGKREMAPCKGCDHRSYRVGLLPDLYGRGKLHAPDAQTAADIEAAIARGPLTRAVLRPWEKE